MLEFLKIKQTKQTIQKFLNSILTLIKIPNLRRISAKLDFHQLLNKILSTSLQIYTVNIILTFTQMRLWSYEGDHFFLKSFILTRKSHDEWDQFNSVQFSLNVTQIKIFFFITLTFDLYFSSSSSNWLSQFKTNFLPRPLAANHIAQPILSSSTVCNGQTKSPILDSLLKKKKIQISYIFNLYHVNKKIFPRWE